MAALGSPAIGTVRSVEPRELNGILAAARQRIEALERLVTTLQNTAAGPNAAADLQTLKVQLAQLQQVVNSLSAGTSSRAGPPCSGSSGLPPRGQPQRSRASRAASSIPARSEACCGPGGSCSASRAIRHPQWARVDASARASTHAASGKGRGRGAPGASVPVGAREDGMV